MQLQKERRKRKNGGGQWSTQTQVQVIDEHISITGWSGWTESSESPVSLPSTAFSFGSSLTGD